MRPVNNHRASFALALVMLAFLTLQPLSAGASFVDDDPFLYENMVYIYDAMMGSGDAFLAQNNAFIVRAEMLLTLSSTLRQHEYQDAATWEVYASGLLLLTNGDFAGAREQFQAAGHFRDADAFLSYLDGRAYEEAGDLEGAIGAYKIAAESLAIARASFERLATPDTLRTLLEDHIADKTYAEAIQLIEAYAAELQNEPYVAQYAAYAKAMVELGANRLDEAEALFAGLAGFMDADAMRIDVGAYRLQQSNDLQGAIEQYIAAQAAAKTDTVVDSDRLYFADTELAKCQKSLYAVAEGLYEQGERENNLEMLQEAKATFQFLGAYEDSAQMAVLAQSRIDAPRHTLGDGIVDREAIDSFRLSFSDTASGPYLVRYYPAAFGFPITEIEVPTPSAVLDNLFPNMSYTMEVTGVVGESNTLTVTGQTLNPAADTAFRWDPGNPFVRIFSYSAADVTAKGWAQVAQDASAGGLPSEVSVRLPESGSLSDSGIGYGMKYSYIPKKDSGRQYPFTAQTLVVLTVAGVGVASESYQTHIASDSSVSVAVHLGNLIDALYDGNPNGLARASQAEVTIYVDGLYAFTQQITLTHK